MYVILSKRLDVMTFEDITGDGRLWVVKYEGDMDNILAITFDKWNDRLVKRFLYGEFQRSVKLFQNNES